MSVQESNDLTIQKVPIVIFLQKYHTARGTNMYGEAYNISKSHLQGGEDRADGVARYVVDF